MTSAVISKRTNRYVAIAQRARFNTSILKPILHISPPKVDSDEPAPTHTTPKRSFPIEVHPLLPVFVLDSDFQVLAIYSPDDDAVHLAWAGRHDVTAQSVYHGLRRIIQYGSEKRITRYRADAVL
jgi:hypothetical protein